MYWGLELQATCDSASHLLIASEDRFLKEHFQATTRWSLQPTAPGRGIGIGTGGWGQDVLIPSVEFQGGTGV